MQVATRVNVFQGHRHLRSKPHLLSVSHELSRHRVHTSPLVLLFSWIFMSNSRSVTECWIRCSEPSVPLDYYHIRVRMKRSHRKKKPRDTRWPGSKVGSLPRIVLSIRVVCSRRSWATSPLSSEEDHTWQCVCSGCAIWTRSSTQAILPSCIR